MRASNQHINVIGLDLVAANERQKPSYVNPELVILRRKRWQYEDELLCGETDLTFIEWLTTDKK